MSMTGRVPFTPLAAASNRPACPGLPQGRVMVHLRGLPTTRDEVFAGKKRLTWGMSQGVFKRPVK